MAQQTRLPVKTASRKDSIWRDLHQDTFRRHIVDLQLASNEVPADPIEHSANEWKAKHCSGRSKERVLLFEAEQQIADDIAFVAAVQEGHKEISAVTLEEQTEPCGLTIRLAANEGLSRDVKDALSAIFDLLNQCANKSIDGASTATWSD